ncbi:MAG: hypothetical protein M0R03_03060 [Novosphingobium sp.]|nr:hypothetical protein [Novosphingobium sp.]
MPDRPLAESPAAGQPLRPLRIRPDFPSSSRQFAGFFALAARKACNLSPNPFISNEWCVETIMALIRYMGENGFATVEADASAERERGFPNMAFQKQASPVA